MSPPPGRPKEGSLPLGGKARSAKGAVSSKAPAHRQGLLPPVGIRNNGPAPKHQPGSQQ